MVGRRTVVELEPRVELEVEFEVRFVGTTVGNTMVVALVELSVELVELVELMLFVKTKMRFCRVEFVEVAFVET